MISNRAKILAEIKAQVGRAKDLKTTMDVAVDGWWIWYPQEEVEEYDQKFRDILGFESEEDFPNVPESWQKQIHPEDLPKALKAFEKHVATRGEHPYFLKVRYYKKDGSLVTVLCRGKVVAWDIDGNPLKMHGTHTLLPED